MEVMAEGETQAKRALAGVLVSLYFSSTFISNRNPGLSTNNGTYFTSSSSPKITVQGREEIWQLRNENPLSILQVKCKRQKLLTYRKT